MADVIPNIFLKDQAEKKIDFVNDNMKVALLSGTYSECTVREAISFDELSTNEIDALYGYVTGGFQVINKTITINGDEIVYDINDIGMTVAGGTFGPVRYGVMYDTSNSNHLVYIFDFLEDKTVNDGAQFKIKIDDDGLMKAKQIIVS